ncbi:MAG: metallophosphoesterase [Candidatus Magnetominusculus sp. LBB02]|nr:metallophosphoesterase [Candidatus Magnetominusculus sp. LBB02]
MTEFSWLHLSDLHWNLDKSKFSWPQVKDEFYENLSKVHDKVGKIDLIIFSGDMTSKGKHEEFEGFKSEMKEMIGLLSSYGSTDVQFLCVPGNHDLLRPDDDEAKNKSGIISASKNWCQDEELRKSFFSSNDHDLKMSWFSVNWTNPIHN